MLIVLYAYLGVARPNRLRPTTLLWILLRPRYLLAASNYQAYVDQWAKGEALEKLVVLTAPTETAFTSEQMREALRQKGAVFDANGLQATLSMLAQRGLLIRESGSWRLAEPLLAQVQARELAPGEGDRLAQEIRQEHPLYAEARRYFAHAGLTIQPSGSYGLLCSSDEPQWDDVSPLYVRLVPERALGLGEFQALCTAAEEAFGESLRGHTAAVVIDRAPLVADLYQIFAIRARQHLTVIPLPRSLMAQSRLKENEAESLQEQIERYAGREDLYDVRGAVSDVLSFFGRGALLAGLERQLSAGHSAMLFGMRKIGKSSLLHRLQEEHAWPIALVDLQGYAGGLEYVYGEALSGWRTGIQASFPKLTLPEWPAGLDGLDPAAQAQAFRRAVVELLGLLASQAGRPGLLLFLDEFDSLFGEPDYARFAAVLRGVAESPRVRGRLGILAAGLEPALNRLDRIGDGRNPLYGFFAEYPAGPMAPEDTRTMVRSIGGHMGIDYEDEALELLVEAGGGHPFLTRQLCSQATRSVERPGRVSRSQAGQALDGYLRDPRNYLAESLWGAYRSGERPAEESLLRSLAAFQPQSDDSLIPPHLPPEEQRVLQLALRHLEDQSLIRCVQGAWTFTIPLYRRYVRSAILNLPDDAAAEAGQ